MRISDWSSDVCSSDLILAMIRGVDHLRMREIGPVAKSFEERPHIPQQRISIRIAVADPILRSAGEARAAAGIGNIPVSSAWQHRSIAQIGLRKLVMNRKMSTDLVHENEFRTMIGKFT